MEKGKVKFFNSTKGFGFISKESGDDLFFHISNVDGQEELAEGTDVEFEIGSGQKGPMAENVRRA